ncbi:MAG: glutathione peroxidase [Gammaproteobacteria bacterium]|nr:glutathione peroxidase [Gammaproteobacteria bacterium]
MLKNREGQRVPEVTFRTRQGHEWVNRTSKNIFDGRTVVVFSLPGAFTPTCSSTHVPRYNQFAPAFKAQGVDEIVCISVNDAFVMNEWQEDQRAGNVTFLPDGNGEFTNGMGLLVGKEDIGFGRRSWRYSMLVRDGVIEKMFIEPEEPGDPFKVSDADTMLNYLAPRAPKPLDVAIFTRKGCPHCSRAKARLAEAGIAYEEMTLNTGFSDSTLRAVTGGTSVPQIFVNGTRIGGADDLEKWLAARKAA